MTANPFVMCCVVSHSGPNGEPLACGYARGHQGAHSWATLPTFPLRQEVQIVINGNTMISEELVERIRKEIAAIVGGHNA
jgi:hypothetical protein